MKNLLGKLKGLKFKKTLIEHGEKFSFGPLIRLIRTGLLLDVLAKRL